jgi:hypothetical protein
MRREAAKNTEILFASEVRVTYSCRGEVDDISGPVFAMTTSNETNNFPILSEINRDDPGKEKRR